MALLIVGILIVGFSLTSILGFLIYDKFRNKNAYKYPENFCKKLRFENNCEKLEDSIKKMNELDNEINYEF